MRRHFRGRPVERFETVEATRLSKGTRIRHGAQKTNETAAAEDAAFHREPETRRFRTKRKDPGADAARVFRLNICSCITRGKQARRVHGGIRRCRS